MPVKLVINTRESDTLINPRITVRYFNEVQIGLKYDSVASTFSFKMYFDPDNKEHAEIACVSHYHEAEIYYLHEKKDEQGNVVSVKEELLITGFILSQSFFASSKEELVQIAGYSKPGVLEDCDIPTSLYPLESNGLTFRQIVQKIIKPFKLSFVVAASNADTKFVEIDDVDKEEKKSTGPESTNIKSYLTELATQKNLVLSHDRKGNLLITNANTGPKSIILDLDLDKGYPVGFVSARMTFNGQPMHSHITVVRQADDEDENSAEATIENKFVPVRAVFRPKVVTMTSGNGVTIEAAARNELGKSLKAISLVIEMDRAAINRKFIFPNHTVKIKSRKLFLYQSTQWFIESVDYKEDSEKETCTLTCVPKFCYNRETPVNFYVDPHENLPRT